MGVFFPVMQNILGVLLFIRVPEITGESGIRDSSLIVFLCVLTTFLTALSLSAIATNGKIKSGGSYYIISRSLGAPVGTAIGFCFYLGNTFAGAMYILGAVEAFITTSGIVIEDLMTSMRIFGACLWALLIFLNYIGLQYVAKFGFPVLMVVLVSILSMYIGVFSFTSDNPNLANEELGLPGIAGLSLDTCTANNDSQYTKNAFFVLLSIYFPSVTGIMAGSNRSGDLQDPNKNIPSGTLAAQMVTSIIYLSFPILFGCVCDRTTLQRRDVLIAAQVAWPTHWLVAIGIMLSSTGAGLQSLASAPRLLFAIAEDEHLPCLNPLKGKPRAIVLVSGTICFAAVMVGEIEAINPIITMFFLLCYTGVNSCCVFMALLNFPNWRPSFRFYHPFLSFLGIVLCVFLMIAISWWAFLAALGLSAILFTVVTYNRKLVLDYGDSISALKVKLARGRILGLLGSKQHVKNYIPIILVLGEVFDDEKIEGLGALQFLKSIRDDTCMTIYGSVYKSDFTRVAREEKKKIQQNLQKVINDHKFLVIPQVLEAENIKNGNMYLMQGAGLAGLEPNIVVLPFPTYNYKEEPGRAQAFVDVISQAIIFGKALIVTKPDEELRLALNYEGFVDLWSFSYEKGLMILLTFFMTRSKQWKKCTFRLFIVIIEPENAGDTQSEMEQIHFYSKNIFQNNSFANFVIDQICHFLHRYRLPILKRENIKVIFLKPQDIRNFVVQDYQKQLYKESSDQTNMAQFRMLEKQVSDNPELIEQQKKDKLVKVGSNDNFIQKTGIQGESQRPNIPKKAVKELSVLTQNQTENINNIIYTHSKDADLVLTNLPDPMQQKASEYLDFLKLLTFRLKRVILMKNDSQQVVTEFT